MAFDETAIELELRFWIEDAQNGVHNVKSQVLYEVWRRCQINLRRAAGTRSRMRIHAAATAFRHSLAASARKIRSVDRETRWR
jgi:small-conductance mechanosensitive channel